MLPTLLKDEEIRVLCQKLIDPALPLYFIKKFGPRKKTDVFITYLLEEKDREAIRRFFEREWRNLYSLPGFINKFRQNINFKLMPFYLEFFFDRFSVQENKNFAKFLADKKLIEHLIELIKKCLLSIPKKSWIKSFLKNCYCPP